MLPRQSRITPKRTDFKPRNPPQTVRPRQLLGGEIVWVGNDGNAYKMSEIADTHLVSIVRLLEGNLKRMREEADTKGYSVQSDKHYLATTDKVLTFLIELAVRGIPYNEVP